VKLGSAPFKVNANGSRKPFQGNGAVIEPRDSTYSEPPEAFLVRGRLAIVFALGRNYLFLPFAVLAMAATILHHDSLPRLAVLPFLLLVVAGFASNRVADAYEQAKGYQDPMLWARRFTILSGVTGAIWGLGAILWFVPNSFPDEAYLALAMLGMSATEFVARAAYRPAYLAHATASLVPLALMLMIQGGTLAPLSALLVLCYGAALYGYSGRVTSLLDRCIVTSKNNAVAISTLSAEKKAAEDRSEAALASDRAKSKFVANISYELRTPLDAILGMAQLLERSDLAKGQRDHVRVLLESCRGLKTLLDDVIALVREDNGAPSPEEGADAAQAVQTVARLLQPNAWEKRLRLSVNVAPGTPRVAADPRLLRRILLKLVGNAVKFTERGHVDISLDALTDAHGVRMARFAVTDTGPGIPQHLIPSLFEPFAKEGDPQAPQREGMGVGLAVAKRLVESLGGTIGVESEPGMGANFWITVPATSVTPLTRERKEAEDVAPPQGLSLLCFLPDAETLSAVERLLTPFGNRVLAARSLAEAGTMSVRGGYDAVIAGASAADALAAIPGQATPILALAAREESRPDGANGVLRWPATPSMLYSALSSITGEAGARSGHGGEDVTPAIDVKAFAELEKSLGFKTLVDILQSLFEDRRGARHRARRGLRARGLERSWTSGAGHRRRRGRARTRRADHGGTRAGARHARRCARKSLGDGIGRRAERTSARARRAEAYLSRPFGVRVNPP
jgi:signal transduction histidine kinase